MGRRDEYPDLYVWLDGRPVLVDDAFDLSQIRPDETWTKHEVEALRGAFDALWDDVHDDDEQEGEE